mmetsp:Transcript_46347/g.115296  ORF Transcript_46347/g.115296 Transcript_46347/m.115296 type:complete len:122 (-) Transcript_46347:243-608(-)
MGRINCRVFLLSIDTNKQTWIPTYLYLSVHVARRSAHSLAPSLSVYGVLSVYLSIYFCPSSQAAAAMWVCGYTHWRLQVSYESVSLCVCGQWEACVYPAPCLSACLTCLPWRGSLYSCVGV